MTLQEALELLDLESPLESPETILQSMFEEDITVADELKTSADHNGEEWDKEPVKSTEGLEAQIHPVRELKRQRENSGDENRPEKKRCPNTTMCLRSRCDIERQRPITYPERKIRHTKVLSSRVMKAYRAAYCPGFVTPRNCDNNDSKKRKREGPDDDIRPPKKRPPKTTESSRSKCDMEPGKADEGFVLAEWSAEIL